MSAEFRARLLLVLGVVAFLAWSTVAVYAHIHIAGSGSECSFCFLSHSPADLSLDNGNVFIYPGDWEVTDEPAQPDLQAFVSSVPSRAPPLAA